MNIDIYFIHVPLPWCVSTFLELQLNMNSKLEVIETSLFSVLYLQAVATMGGLFVDCNSLFCQLSQYTKKEVCAMTIFTLTSRDDLQVAFDLISQMITPSAIHANHHTQCVLRGSMKHRKDLGLSISLIKGEDGIAKYFCVTLIQNPTSPFDTSKPVPATATMISPPSSSGMDPKASDQKGANLSNSATLTSG